MRRFERIRNFQLLTNLQLVILMELVDVGKVRDGNAEKLRDGAKSIAGANRVRKIFMRLEWLRLSTRSGRRRRGRGRGGVTHIARRGNTWRRLRI